MARLTIYVASILLLLSGSVCSLAQTPVTDTLQAPPRTAPGQQMRVDTSRRVLVDSFNQVIGLIDPSGKIGLLHPRPEKRLDWMYTFVTWFIAIGLICLGIIMIAATFRYLFAKRGAQAAGIASDSWKYNITKIISLVLLGAFVLALVSLFFVNLETGAADTVNEKWFEIFKTMLLLLGTSFTTIMGYFFGQAQTASLEKKKDRLEEENRELNDITANLNRQIEVIPPMLNEQIRQEPLTDDPMEELHQDT